MLFLAVPNSKSIGLLAVLSDNDFDCSSYYTVRPNS